MIVTTVVGLFLLLILMVIAIRIGITKEKAETEEEKPVIHASGIYSVVRRSPREDVYRQKPPEEEIRKYLSGKIDILEGYSHEEREALLRSFFERLDLNVKVIEEGDKNGLEFYYFDFDWDDPVCEEYLSKNQYITREDIYHFPRLIPPFHIGCGCRVAPYHGGEKLRDTTEMRTRPLLKDENSMPPLPNWHSLLLPSRG